MRIDFDRFLGFTALLAAGTVMGACSSSSSGGGAIACDEAGTCPNGLVCSQGVCVGGSTGGSGGGPSGGTGGLPSGGTAGVATGGGPSGGSAGIASGGSPPTGGTGGGPTCDTATGTPGSCTASDPANECQVCIETSCCFEYGACAQSTPDDNCAWGGPNAEGEIICFQDCVLAAGVADATTQANCASSCTTPGCSTISSKTNDLIGCLNNSCFADCLQP